jgi:Cu-Zn family superoxide dismutase
MRPVLLPLAALSMLSAGCVMDRSGGANRAQAEAPLFDAAGKLSGRAIISEAQDGLWLDVTANGITPGAHGLHVHAVGRCDAPDFATAGPHWNPTAHEHGRKNPNGTHLGDAPNLIADAAGKGRLKSWLSAGVLSALMDADGAAVVVHADPDDEMTDPSGKSGKRILCGVLTAR